MRVPPVVLKSIGFVAEVVGSDLAIDDSLLIGTAFIVSVPAKSLQNHRHYYVVTAKHVLKEKPNTRIVVLVNQKSGGMKPLNIFGWYQHPDPSVDVAVGIFVFDPAADNISTFGLEDAFDDADREPFGVGDEVFFPGLFHLAPGISRVVPTVRHGNVALLPDEQIQVRGTFAHVYLIEARSIGGVSGSPVWIRETIEVRVRRDSGHPTTVKGLGQMKLLGLMQGHWDVEESEINEVNFQPAAHGVNLGIAIVIPAAKILETINLPELAQQREEIETLKRSQTDPMMDAGDRSE